MVPGISGNLTSISWDQTFLNHTDKITGELIVVQGFLFLPRSCNEVEFTYNKLHIFHLCNLMFWPMNVPVKLSPQSRKWTCLSHPEVSSFLEFYVNRTTQHVFFFGLASVTRHNYCGFLHFAVDSSTHFITEQRCMCAMVCLPIQLLMGTRVVYSLGLFQIKLLWMFVHKSFILLGEVPGVDSWS